MPTTLNGQPTPHSQLFLSRLLERGIPREAVAVLEQAGARDVESALSLLRCFPSIAARGLLNAADLSLAVAEVAGPSFTANLRRVEAEKGKNISPHSFGARPPQGWVDPGEVKLVNRLEAGSANKLLFDHPLDVRGCLSWPVRSQGQRPTCVAFAATAVYEQHFCRSTGQRPDLSEQFLFWAIKTQTADSYGPSRGTWLNFGRDALRSHGICTAARMPYSDGLGVADPSALADAVTRRLGMGEGAHETTSHDSGKAAPILDAIRAGRVVAISLPVFQDPLSRDDNWATPVGWLYGRVLDPPPTSIITDGHAVCVTGFVSDPGEPAGGHFIIRNSWFTDWGHALPSPGHFAPEPGYGQISASYVDRYLWEYFVL